jgi:hypothetical protein
VRERLSPPHVTARRGGGWRKGLCDPGAGCEHRDGTTPEGNVRQLVERGWHVPLFAQDPPAPPCSRAVRRHARLTALN